MPVRAPPFVEQMVMTIGTLNEFQAGELLGEGGCGQVNAWEDADSRLLAIKRFDAAAVNLPLLERMTRRLAMGGWPPGVLAVLRDDFSGIPAVRISPLLASRRENGTGWVPLSLQHQWDTATAGGALELVNALARALAGMHERGVAHGNLKPGNVFLDESGAVLLTDWAMGNMPGTGVFHFTDAVLYQPPEQLRGASAYGRPASLQWDVFAFGVLAFRILTGRFPRCHETFQRVCPQIGRTRRPDLDVNPVKLAEYLESKQSYHWPDPPSGVVDDEVRICIDRCLNIDPDKRPSDMARVSVELQWISITGNPGGVPEEVAVEIPPDGMLLKTTELWTHAPQPGTTDKSSLGSEVRKLPEVDLWDFEDEMDLDFGEHTLVAAARMKELPGDASAPHSGLIAPVPEIPVIESVAKDAEPLAPMTDASPRWEQSVSGDSVGGKKPPAQPAVRGGEDWLEAEKSDVQEIPPIKGRTAKKSRRRPDAVKRDSPILAVPVHPAWSILEKWVFLILACGLATAGWMLLGQSILHLPRKVQRQPPVLPLTGETLTLHSVALYWRAPVTEGDAADVCRPGTLLLPELEMRITGGPSTLRVLFKNQDGVITGDPVIRSVSSEGTLRMTGTAGFDEPGTWAAYRTGGVEPWTVEVEEIPPHGTAGGKARRLLNLDILAERR